MPEAQKKYNENILISENIYARIRIKTHLIGFGENCTELIRRYVLPQFQTGDFVAISEKVVSVCQNNMRHISTVKAGWLAKLIVRGVKKYPNDIGFSSPKKMQVAVELAGAPRMMLAIALGALGKLVGIRGIFWRIAGNRVSEIDGFNPDAMYPYTEYAILPPREPERVCAEIERATGIPAIIIDGNNVNVKIIAMSAGVPMRAKLAREILLDNPMGQDDELTPFILVRKKFRAM